MLLGNLLGSARKKYRKISVKVTRRRYRAAAWDIWLAKSVVKAVMFSSTGKASDVRVAHQSCELVQDEEAWRSLC